MWSNKRVLPVFLGLLLVSGCSSAAPEAKDDAPAATEEVVVVEEEQPKDSKDGEVEEGQAGSVLSEDEALAALASISSAATSQQWRSIAKAVCEEYESQHRPLDELGETSRSVLDEVQRQDLFHGTGDVAAAFPGKDLQPAQAGMLLLGSTELACPKWTPDAAAFAQELVAEGD